MKKLIALSLILTSMIFFAGCSSNSDGTIEISERFFINDINNIIFNRNDYLGRTIQYEGIFDTIAVSAFTEVHLVYRYVPGCCGPEGIAGFLVDLGDFAPLSGNAWAEVVGVLEEFEDHNGNTNIRLALTSLTEMDTRGAEFVTP